MSSVIAEFIKQPVIGILHQFVEGRKVWLAVAGAFAAAEERSNRSKHWRNYVVTNIVCRCGLDVMSEDPILCVWHLWRWISWSSYS